MGIEYTPCVVAHEIAITANYPVGDTDAWCAKPLYTRISVSSQQHMLADHNLIKYEKWEA